MKTNILRSLTAAAALFVAGSAMGQVLHTGYFDDNYLYRYQMNPAFANEGGGFVAMPTLGNLGIATYGTVGVQNFIYNIDGRTTTFLNPKVTSSEFLSKLKDKNRLGLNLNETVLAFGFKGFGGYNTFTVSTRVDVGLFLPKDLLRLAKEGISNSTYDISNTGARAQGWVEIGVGHSHQINSKLRIGANLKFLIGAGNAEAKFKEASIALQEDTWVGTANAELNASVKGLTYKTDYNENTQRHYVSDVDVDNSGINGYGFSADLGAVYTINQDWEVSASLLNLGAINWKNNMLATTNGTQQVSTDKYSFNVDDDTSLDKLKDDLSYLYQLEDAGDQGSRTTGLGVTLNLGGQYTLPVYRKVKFGALAVSRFQGDYSWFDGRLSATIEPVKWFSLTANMSMGTFGFGFGGMINIRANKGFNLFLASDRIPGKLAKQGVPLNSNANLHIGLNFPF